MTRTTDITGRWLATARCWAMALLLAVAGAAPAFANEEEDFVSHYMRYCDGDSSLQCVTLSPQMILAATKVADAANDSAMTEVLTHIHSMRIVTLGEEDKKSGKGDVFYAKALDLIRQNPRRYQAFSLPSGSESTGSSVWMRKKDEVILEIVLVVNTPEEGFTIVDVTGEMNDRFVTNMVDL